MTHEEAQRIADAMAKVWPHSLGDAVHALNEAGLPFRFRAEMRKSPPGYGHVVLVEPEPPRAALPTSAGFTCDLHGATGCPLCTMDAGCDEPVPTSADKPPPSQSEHEAAGKVHDVDPVNPSPPSEPAPADPWALPDRAAIFREIDDEPQTTGEER